MAELTQNATNEDEGELTLTTKFFTNSIAKFKINDPVFIKDSQNRWQKAVISSHPGCWTDNNGKTIWRYEYTLVDGDERTIGVKGSTEGAGKAVLKARKRK